MTQVQEKTDIQKHVEFIKSQLECKNNNWIKECEDIEEPSAYEYLNDMLDIQYIVNSESEYLGARILIAFGGPNIWINTLNNTVEGYWWGDTFITHFDDELGVDEVAREMWECK